MKKAIITFAVLLCVVTNPITVHAGSLNENESAVVGVAQGEFEVDGVKYRVDASYIDALINYLCQDDIDLTAAQKDAAIQKIYGNVKKGVTDGYLVPVEQKNSTSAEDGNDDSLKDGKAEVDEKNGSDSKANQKDASSDTGDFVTDIMDSKEFVGKETDPTASSNQASSSLTVTSTVIDKKTSTIRVVNDQDESLLTVNTTIKNTGFNMIPTIVVFALLATILICSVVVAIRYIYFARMNE